VEIEFPSYAYDFEGRTVYRDGKEVRFNDRKDFSLTKTSTASGYEDKRTLAIPPGVTSDCVVEMRWAYLGNYPYGPFPSGIYQLTVPFGGAFRTLVAAVEIPGNYPLSWQLFAAPNQKPVETRGKIERILTLENLPAFEQTPYSLDAVEPYPKVCVYYQPEYVGSFVKKPPMDYWNAVVKTYFKTTYGSDVKIGDAFRAFASNLVQELAPDLDPAAKAFKLLLRLQAEWVNTDELSFGQQAKRTRKQDKQDWNPSDLEAAAIAKETDPEGFSIAYLHLLKAAGCKPHLGLVINRMKRIFDVNFRNLWQFQEGTTLVGIEVPGQGIQWFEPSAFQANPGLILPNYQGTIGLDVDVATWTIKDLVVPTQTQGTNQWRFDYTVRPGEEQDSFTLSSMFTGFPEYSLRSQYRPLEPKEQSRLLKEGLEAHIPGSTIQKAEILHAADPSLHLAWAVEGQMEGRTGRRKEVTIFPGMTKPVIAPSSMPAERTRNIYLPHLWTHTATSRILIPKGYHCGPLPPAQKANAFGTVNWSAASAPKGDQTEITITLKMEMNRASASPAGYDQLKAYLAWVQEYCNRTLILDKD